MEYKYDVFINYMKKYVSLKKTICILITLLVCVKVSAQEAYAALSDDNKTLTFYYDNEKSNRNVMSIGPFENISDRGWHDCQQEITTIVFDDSFANFKDLTSTKYWFWYCTSVTDIKGLANLKTDNVKNMAWMFCQCQSLRSLDVSTFNTSKVRGMTGMFAGCESLTTLDLSNFDTSNVEVMEQMFFGCISLKSINLSSFNTSNTYCMRMMFCDCASLTDLDLSNFDTSGVGPVERIFEGCKSLKTLNISSFDTSGMNNMHAFFHNCESLTELDLSNFNTSIVGNMDNMFEGCTSLVKLNLSSFDTSFTSNMEYMFRNCKSLVTLDLSSFNSSWNSTMMFSGCSSLTTIYVSDKWNNLISGKNMFSSCKNLVGGKGTKFDKNYTNQSYARIDGGPESPGYLTEKSTTGMNRPYRDNNYQESFYSLDGICIDNPIQKGIYIVNGQKIVVK